MARFCIIMNLAALLMGCDAPPVPQAPEAETRLENVEADTSPARLDVPPKVERGQLTEGVYCTGREVSRFSGTILELKQGTFRYWSYTDIETELEPDYPLTGEYTFEENRLALKGGEVNQPLWHYLVINGHPLLVRDPDMEYWKRDRSLGPYGTLIWTTTTINVANQYEIERPSIIVHQNAAAGNLVNED